MASALKEFKLLNHLEIDLDNNKIKDNGAKELASALKELKLLNYLRIRL